MTENTNVSTIAPAAESDLPAILAMQRDFYREDGYPYDPARITPALAELLRDARYGRVWLATSDGQPSGYLLLTYSYSVERGGRLALIDELYVRPETRGQGIGTHLLAATQAHCQEAGIATLLLEVERGNTDARRLYTRLGFTAYDRDLMWKPL